MIDYSVLLYDPVYAAIGVPATLSTGTAGEITLTVKDETRRATQTSGNVEVRSVKPSAFARIPELTAKGIGRGDWQDAILTFNGRSWVIYNHEIRGSPNGEDLGEVRFLLRALESTNG